MKILRNLIYKCIEFDPAQRPSIEAIILILRDSLNFIEKIYL